jgi:hypothetical protein
MKMCGRVDVWIHVSFPSAIVGGEWSLSPSGRFTPEKRTRSYPSDKELGGPQSRSGRRREEDILEPIEDLSHSSSPVPEPLVYLIIVRVMRPRKTIWAGHVTRMDCTRMFERLVVGIHKRKREPKRICHRWQDITNTSSEAM